MGAIKVLSFIGGLLLLLLFASLLAPGPLGGPVPPLDMLLVFLGLVGIAALSLPWIIRSARTADDCAKPSNPPLSAEEILRERFARGELDRAQFSRMLNDLKEISNERRSGAHAS